MCIYGRFIGPDSIQSGMYHDRVFFSSIFKLPLFVVFIPSSLRLECRLQELQM